MRTLYVGCGLTHTSDTFRESIKKLKERLGTSFKILDFVGLTSGTNEDVYRWDIEHCVGTCDVFVAICDEASTGLGFELAIATTRGIPILAVAQKSSLVTRLVLGAAECNENIHFQRYDTHEDLYQIIITHFARTATPI